MLILATQSFLLSWAIVLKTKFISHCLIAFSPFQSPQFVEGVGGGEAYLIISAPPPKKKEVSFSLSLTPLDQYYQEKKKLLLSKEPVLNVLHQGSLQNHHILLL